VPGPARVDDAMVDGGPVDDAPSDAAPVDVEQTATREPGWYPDEDGELGELRYWDGAAWTEQRSRLEPSIPLPPPPSIDPPIVPTVPPRKAERVVFEMPEPKPWKLTPARRFLMFASGAVPRLLLKSPTDIPGMLALGAIVTSVGVIAAASMTFALSMAFNTSLLAVAPLGLAWGAIIFNLDRWLLASARKMPNIIADFFAMLPRLLLAVLVGFVVSEPLVLRVFETAIEEQLTVEQAERRTEAQERRDEADAVVAKNNEEIIRLRAEQAPLVPGLAEGRAQIDAYRAEIDTAKARWDEAELILTQEIEGLSVNGQAGCGPVCRLKTQTRDSARAEYERILARNTALIDEQRALLAPLEQQQQAANAAFIEEQNTKIARLEAESVQVVEDATRYYERETSDRPAGILERMSALHEVEKDNGALKGAHWALAGMLIALDVLPVLGKFLNNRGPKRVYDMLIAAEEDDMAARIEAHAAARDAEAALSMTFLADNHELRRTIEAENTERYLRHVGAVHADIAKGIVQEWERNEKARVFADLMARMIAEAEPDPSMDWLRPYKPTHDSPTGTTGNGNGGNGAPSMNGNGHHAAGGDPVGTRDA
jgi:hypothetical protein